MENKRVITAPDLDFTPGFKLMLVDFDWSDIQLASQALKELNIDCTLYLYGGDDEDTAWCVNAVRDSQAVLVNLRYSSSKDILKGWLLREPNVGFMGQADQLSNRKYIDLLAWIAIQYQYYQSKEEDNGVRD
jgi:hypothetical protein